MKLKHVFPSFITVIGARLSIIYWLGGRGIFGEGESHGFKLEQRGISRGKNYIVTQAISADPQAVNNYWSFTVLSFLFYLPSALLTKITSRQTFLL